jgi:hypothetical protein
VKNISLRSAMWFDQNINNRGIDLNEIYQWFLDYVLSKVWLLPDWQKCAKGGYWPKKREFSEHNDMPLLAHIISGIGISLKIVEIALKTNSEKIIKLDDQELEKRLKRAAIGFLFHDYNKVNWSSESYLMNKKDVFYKVIDNIPGIDETIKELGFSKDDIYQIAISTEQGTTFNAYNIKINQDLNFEQDFSRMADRLSSIFNFDEPNLNNLSLIFYGFSLDHSKIHKIKFAQTIYYTFTDLIKQVLIDILKSEGRIYLWSTYDAIYYYGEILNLENELDNIAEEVYKEFLKRVKFSSTTNFNDRRVSIPSKGIIPITEEDIKEFVIGPDKEKFKNIFWMENKSADSIDREKIFNYQNEANKNLKTLKFSFKNDLKFRGSLEDLEVDSENIEQVFERLKIFIIRFLQLENRIDGSYINIIKNRIEELKNNTILEPFRKKIKNISKSAFLIPILINDPAISRDIWENALKEILEYINKLEKNNINVKSTIHKITSLILMISPEEFPEVPSKNNMSLINGYPAELKALAENMYGLNTNSTFTNRIITSNIGNAQIDFYYILESLLRNSVISKNPLTRTKDLGSSIFYITFPGAIPYIDMDYLLNKIQIENKNNIKRIGFSRIEELYTGINEINKKFLIDNSFIAGIEEISTNEKALEILYYALNIVKYTKMKVLVTESHSPPIKTQKEILSFETSTYILKDLRINKVRCNQIEEKLNFLELINLIAGKSLNIDFKMISKILSDYIMEPISIFSYIMKHENNKKSKGIIKTLGFENIEKIEELINYEYEIKKHKRGEKIMDDLKELARSAVALKRPGFSSSERTWMLRDSLEALEKWSSFDKSSDRNDIEKMREIIEGVVYKGLKSEYNVPKEKVEDFANSLVKFLKNHFNGKIPTGSIRSYLINAFEFEYIVEYNYSSSKKED